MPPTSTVRTTQKTCVAESEGANGSTTNSDYDLLKNPIGDGKSNHDGMADGGISMNCESGMSAHDADDVADLDLEKEIEGEEVLIDADAVGNTETTNVFLNERSHNEIDDIESVEETDNVEVDVV